MRLGIVDVAETYLKLEKAGGNYKARCPFHNEKTPSFIVSPGRETYHCFGCSKGGDMFDLVAEIEGLDFRGALKVLAERAGVELKAMTGDARIKKSETDAQFAALEIATRWFESQLRKESRVVEYLKERGLTGETAKKFRIGYAPNEWRALSEELAKANVSVEVLEKVGLIIRSPKGFYDRFRGRIMFPLSDSSGRVVAYSGRVFEPALTGDEDHVAKYINSPETTLFNKSLVMYGFDKAKQEMRKAGACVIVEGQMDIVMSHQAGVTNVVAVSGTALTTEHLTKIKRLTETVIFAFDADDAGLRAAERGVDLALAMGFDVRIVALPNGKDPADVVRDNPDTWKKLVADAGHIIDFLFDQIINGEGDFQKKRKEVEQKLLPYIAKLESSIEQAQYVSNIAGSLGVKEDAVWDALMAVPTKVLDIHGDTILKAEPPQAKEKLSRIELFKQELIGVYMWQKGQESPTIDLEALSQRFTEISGNDIQVVYTEYTPEIIDKIIMHAEMDYQEKKVIDTHVSELLDRFEIEVILVHMQEVSLSLRGCSEGSNEQIELLTKHTELGRKIEQLRIQLG